MTSKSRAAANQITKSSTAEYFSKNLQQVGFSSLTKAVLTTLKEAVDNSLDACEDHGILPNLRVEVKKMGKGTLKNSDRVRVLVSDNGPGISPEDVPKVFGEYLASSKFGRGRCSRGQQGIGISAATTWSQLTSATGAKVISKTEQMRKAVGGIVDVDIKNNRGVLREKKTFEWDRPHGTEVQFEFDGKAQVNGEAGILNYLMGNVLVNPHLTLTFQLPNMDEPVTIDRVDEVVPRIPDPTPPHPHTMKLGEFITHSHHFDRVKVPVWLKTGFSRIGESAIGDLRKKKAMKPILNKMVTSVTDAEIKALYSEIQELPLKAPSTQTVLSIGEQGLAKSIQRMGEIDFFAVNTRKPQICDFKPVQVEVAIARLTDRKASENDEPVQMLRFANRVPLQFDKAGCAVFQAITSVKWKSYGIAQPKKAMPIGPYIIAVSVVSPFIKFKNASKETIDASDELVEEIRRALMQAGQRLSRHIRREHKEAALEQKTKHIEQFAPILVETLARILKAPRSRVERAEAGLTKILGRDAKEAKKELKVAATRLDEHLEHRARRIGQMGRDMAAKEAADNKVEADAQAKIDEAAQVEVDTAQAAKKSAKKSAKKMGKKTAKKAGKPAAAAKKKVSAAKKKPVAKRPAKKPAAKKSVAKKTTAKKSKKKSK